MTVTTDQQAARKAQRAVEVFEVAVTILLALATVATAWSSYQADRWNGEEAQAAARASALRIESSQAADRGNSFAQIDIITFTQWIDAHAHQEDALATFYRMRFRPEFAVAFDAWLATNPFTAADAPSSPFAMPQYVRADTVLANQLSQNADAATAQARQYLQRSSNYVLGVVLFAAVLFFAGLSIQFRTRPLRLAVLMLGCAVFFAAVGWLATFPVSIAV
jgi:hypothetical protein